MSTTNHTTVKVCNGAIERTVSLSYPDLNNLSVQLLRLALNQGSIAQESPHTRTTDVLEEKLLARLNYPAR